MHSPCRRRPGWRHLLAAALLLATTLGAQATIVTLTLSGKITRVDPALNGSFAIDEAVTLLLRYDPATPAAGSNGSTAVYDFLAFELHFGNYDASFNSDAASGRAVIVVADNVNTFLGPADAFGTSAYGGGRGAAVGGGSLQQGFFALYDTSETALQDDHLPLNPSLAAFPSNASAGLSFCRDAGCGVGSLVGSVEAQLSAMDVVINETPEPASGALVLAACAGACVGRGRIARKRL